MNLRRSLAGLTVDSYGFGILTWGPRKAEIEWWEGGEIASWVVRGGIGCALSVVY